MMRLSSIASVLATTFLAVTTARFVTHPGISDTVADTNTAQLATAIESAPTYVIEGRQAENNTGETGNQTTIEWEYGANNTKRDVFSDDVTLYLKECSEEHEKGNCFMHEVVRSGSCHTRKYKNQPKTYIPDRGVSCHMLDSVCGYAFSWIADFQYPGTSSTGEDPMWRYMYLVDVQSFWCWIPSGNDPYKKTTPHFWYLPKMWRPMPWWQAPGVLPQGLEYDAKWDYPRNGMP